MMLLPHYLAVSDDESNGWHWMETTHERLQILPFSLPSVTPYQLTSHLAVEIEMKESNKFPEVLARR